MPKELVLGHSPDADDAFLFYALLQGKVDTTPYRIREIAEGIEELNERAFRGELDVTALSFHAYPRVGHLYELLPIGASMGEGYGPVVVARRPLGREELRRAKLGLPGRWTSATLALQLYLERSLEELRWEEVPFEELLDWVAEGKGDAGVIIHEGQLRFQELGLCSCVDLGRWWWETRRLPLPLGGNVIRRSLDPELKRRVVGWLRESLGYARNHGEEALAYAARFGRGLDRERLARFVGMYVNDRTWDCGREGRQAVERFLGEGQRRGWVDPCELRWWEGESHE
ncbi:MqnA/MqnD/SBP family protein [Candidatus Methylacidithermus pantelleriae]|uniref:1,4-dihydroxy-6-naphtoate synthase n=1 Tax=Candidatus Methylacidithermus pantelleriae TaxID=2744239 RepID=A0A8J2FN17_9BACT|nr:MqnA/MqnD/SBP family protein [Candidatus Methylacidithermus pantelleriae]CAF0689259.1 1,4-dihydroxy-6-naphtoate synthase [Candidatus Methylacidithermus pantelleriae]